jgi:hypothetical protein
VGKDLDEPLVLERSERLADRASGCPELIGESDFWKRAAGRELAAHDGISDVARDRLGEGLRARYRMDRRHEVEVYRAPSQLA